MKTNYLLTIKAGDRPGLLHLLTGVLNRKLIPVASISAAPTDIQGIVLVTMEVAASEKALQPLLSKIENLIEVFAVETLSLEKAVTIRSAFFLLDKRVLASPQALAISKLGGEIVNLHPDTIIVSKSGSDAVIRQLYDALDGPFLLGFSQTGLIADSALINNDESSVIRRAA